MGSLLGPDRSLALRRGARRLGRRLPPAWDKTMRELGKAALNYRGARATMLRGVVFSVVSRFSPLLTAPFGKGSLLVDARDKEISRVVYATGGYEREYMEWALHVLSSSSAAPERGGIFVDVGANIGTSTVDALIHFGFERAVCFEPDRRNLKLLRMNLLLNGLDDRASVHHAALSSHDGEVGIERTPGNFGDTRVVADAETGDRVRCMRLDGLVEGSALPLDQVGLVWIDVQGHEPFVLAGATTIIEHHIPVVVEYSPQALRSTGGLELLEEFIVSHFETIVDVRLLAPGVSASARLDSADVGQLRDRYDDWDHTDLLLLR